MSSLLGKLVSYTNLTQGAKEHEEAESGEGGRRRAAKVSNSGSAEGPHLERQTLPWKWMLEIDVFLCGVEHMWTSRW